MFHLPLSLTVLKSGCRSLMPIVAPSTGCCPESPATRSGFSRDMVEGFILERSRVSAFSSCCNKEIRYLKATFNFGKKEGVDYRKLLNWLKFFAHG